MSTYRPTIVIVLTGSMNPPTGGSIREVTVNNVPGHVVDDDLTLPEVYLKS